MFRVDRRFRLVWTSATLFWKGLFFGGWYLETCSSKIERMGWSHRRSKQWELTMNFRAGKDRSQVDVIVQCFFWLVTKTWHGSEWNHWFNRSLSERNISTYIRISKKETWLSVDSFTSVFTTTNLQRLQLQRKQHSESVPPSLRRWRRHVRKNDSETLDLTVSMRLPVWTETTTVSQSCSLCIWPRACWYEACRDNEGSAAALLTSSKAWVLKASVFGCLQACGWECQQFKNHKPDILIFKFPSCGGLEIS